MKTCLLMTLYRRYHELEQNLWYVRCHLFRELDEIPEIVLVWAQPEEEKRDFIRNLELTHVIERAKIPLESEQNVSYPESRNLRIGLEYIRDNMNCDYVIVQTADAFPKDGTYKLIQNDMNVEDTNIVSWKWPHAPYIPDVKCTNFFAIKMKSLQTFWPPISNPEAANTLEMDWLVYSRLAGIKIYPEPSQHFFHNHEASKLAEYLNQRREKWISTLHSNRFFIGSTSPKFLFS